jgi:hypothetical protein
MFNRQRHQQAPMAAAQALPPATGDADAARNEFGQPFLLGTDLYDLAYNRRIEWQAMRSPNSSQLVLFGPQPGMSFEFNLAQFPVGQWVALWAGEQQLPLDIFIDRRGVLGRWHELP